MHAGVYTYRQSCTFVMCGYMVTDLAVKLTIVRGLK